MAEAGTAASNLTVSQPLFPLSQQMTNLPGEGAVI